MCWIAEITDIDSEIWNSDIEGDTRKEVIKEGMRMAKEEGLVTFRIGRQIPIGIPTLDIDSILEGAYDQVYDEVGEVAEGFLEGVTSEQQKELEEKLNEVFYNWIKKHKFEPSCYIVVDDEFIEVK
ncbi:hypothetical protein ADU80_04860 [Clostridium botulinum]|uniref:hypothetical protein n=1 Tax=Clostridium botulinum TaxID=1491 RepID=UPI0002075002|nr:hypothetical protein [Clostridium botulinum]AEB77654.1 hypothetical phage protein [Clostridium botulinum BKT015925]KLU74238.1 hypothetical protein CBC3_p0236 [Clostridium botulinum V891]KOA86398.1 hypothetical protein ADU80_04860 [Clostridium botulinum]KOC34065.1 hypothetical protein ADU82_10800 [Clostridium botulinum]KOC42082.1 hypothetical protein ADU84_06780 [Clostridium botulinum]